MNRFVSRAWGASFSVTLFSLAFAPAIAFGIVRSASAACWIPALQSTRPFNPEILRGVTTIDDVPSVLGPLRENWTLAYRSESTQTADYRVISFNPESNAIVAFTGCDVSKKSGLAYPNDPYPECEHAEVMKFHSPREEVVLSSYHLPGKRFPQLPVKHTGPNPEKCTSCHGSPPMPRFEPYNTWPGFFGSRSRDGEDIMRKGYPEHQLYVQFLNRVFSEPLEHRRYVEMKWRHGEPLQPQGIDAERLVFHLNLGEVPIRIQHSGNPGPNPELNKMLGTWRARSMIKKLVTSEKYERMKYALMAMSLECNHVRASGTKVFTVLDFLPPSLSDKTGYALLAAQIEQDVEIGLKATRELVDLENPMSSEGRYRMVGSDPTGRVLAHVQGLAYLWRLAGHAHSSWNVSGHAQRFNFNDGRSALGPVFHTFVDYVRTCDGDLSSYLPFVESEIFAGVHANVPLESPKLLELCRDLARKGSEEPVRNGLR